MKKSGLATVFTLAAALVLGGIGSARLDAAYRAAGPAAASGPQIGSVMQDASVYAGISPDTHKPFYTTPADAPGIYNWDEASAYCSALDASGHEDWRPPTKYELNAEFDNRAAIGGFNETGADPGGWYWSSTQDGRRLAWDQRFAAGDEHDQAKFHHASLRCVR